MCASNGTRAGTRRCIVSRNRKIGVAPRRSRSQSLRRRSGNLAGVALLLLAAASAVHPAHSQRTHGTSATIVFGWGDTADMFSWEWKGISPTVVYGEDTFVQYDRHGVAGICHPQAKDPEQCRRDLPKGQISEDLVVLQSGETLPGDVEWIACHLDDCLLQQASGKSVDWETVKYIQFAPIKDGAGGTVAEPAKAGQDQNRKFLTVGFLWGNGKGFQTTSDKWDGMSPTVIYGDNKYISFDRRGLRSLCQLQGQDEEFAECFARLPNEAAGRDVVVLQSGETVPGNVEWIACHLNRCVLRQDSGAKIDWATVKGIRFTGADRG